PAPPARTSSANRPSSSRADSRTSSKTSPATTATSNRTLALGCHQFPSRLATELVLLLRSFRATGCLPASACLPVASNAPPPRLHPLPLPTSHPAASNMCCCVALLLPLRLEVHSSLW